MTYQIVKKHKFRFFYENRQLKAMMQISDEISDDAINFKSATVRLEGSLLKNKASQLAIYTTDFKKFSEERILSFMVSETNSELGTAIFQQIKRDFGSKPNKIKVLLI